MGLMSMRTFASSFFLIQHVVHKLLTIITRKQKQAAKIFCIIYSVEIVIVNTICISSSMEKIQIRGIFFVALIDRNYNRWLCNDKMTRFTIFVRDGWGG